MRWHTVAHARGSEGYDGGRKSVGTHDGLRRGRTDKETKE